MPAIEDEDFMADDVRADNYAAPYEPFQTVDEIPTILPAEDQPIAAMITEPEGTKQFPAALAQ